MGSKPNTEYTYGIAPTRVAFETQKAIDEGYRLITHQGGTRSGKTYGIQDLLIGLAYRTNLSISVCSISLPHLKKGAMRDWRELMEAKGDYNPNFHNMTDQLYKYPLGSYMEFFSVDDAKRVRGPGRDILHINEANLLSLETYRQLSIRTRKTIILDYNPADEFSWIYDEVLPRKDCKFIQTTYLDNPFLSREQRAEIEHLKDVDENFWKVYGLGERGTAQETIYHKFELYDKAPELDHCFGLDFGFNHPNALVKVTYHDGKLYMEQKFYQSHTTASDLIKAIKPIVGLKYVYCDGSRPEIIEELRRAGITAYPADKTVKEGIDYVRSNRIFVHRESLDLQKEMRSYKWKKRPNGQTLDEPVKAFDDLMDAMRYGAISYKQGKISMSPSFY
jgi:phage terminase large subunit